MIDAWDQRCAATYLESIFVPELLKQKGDFVLAPGLRAFSQGTFADARAHIDEKVPDDSPALFGIHANAETAHLVAEAEHTFASILELSGAGGGGRAGSSAPPAAREAVVMRKLGDLQLKLPHKRQASDVRPKVEGRGSPYVVFFSQEIERLNLIFEELRRDMAELELGLTGTLNITDAMDTLISCLYLDMVPLNWLAACGQSGPNGPYTSRSLTPWFADLMLRDRHLADWEMRSSGLPVSAPAPPLLTWHPAPCALRGRAWRSRCPDAALPPALCACALPQPSVWISGLFNPMGFVTACLQVTARAKQLPLDSLSIRTTCTSFPFEQVRRWRAACAAGWPRVACLISKRVSCFAFSIQLTVCASASTPAPPPPSCRSMSSRRRARTATGSSSRARAGAARPGVSCRPCPRSCTRRCR